MSEIMKNITRGDQLGRGAYATVYLGTDKRTGEKFALKVLAEPVNDEAESVANDEAELMRGLDHVGIVKWVILNITNSTITNTLLFRLIHYEGTIVEMNTIFYMKQGVMY